MFCGFCGKESSIEHAYCTKCGKALGETDTPLDNPAKKESMYQSVYWWKDCEWPWQAKSIDGKNLLGSFKTQQQAADAVAKYHKLSGRADLFVSNLSAKCKKEEEEKISSETPIKDILGMSEQVLEELPSPPTKNQQKEGEEKSDKEKRLPLNNSLKAGFQFKGLKKLIIFDDRIEYKHNRIELNEIKHIKFSAVATKQSVNFIPMGTAYESDLCLILKNGKHIKIKQEIKFLAVSQKEPFESILEASEAISILTFESRINVFESDFKERGYLKINKFHLHANGDLFKKEKFLFNIMDNDVSLTIGPFQLNVNRNRTGLGVLLGEKEYTILTDVDRDCILYMFKYYFNIIFEGTPVRKQIVA